MDERAEIASACMFRFKFSFPMVLNNLSDDVEKAYMTMLARVYISDAFGTVTWKCDLGPHLFDLLGFEKNKRSLQSLTCSQALSANVRNPVLLGNKIQPH